MYLHPHHIIPDFQQKLQTLLENCPTYFNRVYGRAPHADEGQRLLEMQPKSAKYPYLKEIWGGLHAGQGTLVAVIDILKDYPAPKTVFLGLLLIHEGHQNQGLGRAAFNVLEAHLRDAGYAKIRLAVADSNPVHAFWQAMGFHAVAQKAVADQREIAGSLTLMEKQL